MIVTAPTPAHMAFATQHGIVHQSSPLWNGDGEVFDVPQDQFGDGLRQAIDMSSFFANQGDQDSTDWQLAAIATDFGLSIGGHFSLVTVDVTGQIGLGFKRKK